ncbi:MAG: Flp family type IVb pilin [Burkholderiaceae bacterium]|nr:Flp family type IVb pilin [Burkholderiaceae bacterium]
MGRFIQAAKQFARDEEGVTAIEYGLIAALIAVVIVGAVRLTGTTLNGIFGDIQKALKP